MKKVISLTITAACADQICLIACGNFYYIFIICGQVRIPGKISSFQSTGTVQILHYPEPCTGQDQKNTRRALISKTAIYFPVHILEILAVHHYYRTIRPLNPRKFLPAEQSGVHNQGCQLELTRHPARVLREALDYHIVYRSS